MLELLGLLEELLGPLGLFPAGFEIVDQKGVDNDEIRGVVPVKGGSWSLLKTSVPWSKIFREARREDLSTVQMTGQLMRKFLD